MEIFAILQELEDTQFFAHKWYNPDDDTFNVMYKFWSESFNGFISATMRWNSEKETNADQFFEKFNDIEHCKKFKLGTEAKLTGNEES